MFLWKNGSCGKGKIIDEMVADRLLRGQEEKDGW